jgi:hypothetical protein
MFDRGKHTYKSDLKLGEKYRDRTTGLTGHCVSVHFFEHACERATLRYVDSQQNMREESFDAPELELVSTGEVARTTKTGGPARADGRRR